MSTYGYIRLDNSSPIQKRELVRALADYASQIGVAAPTPEFIVEDFCDPTTALDKRPGFSQLRLSEGDTLLITHWGSIGGHATSAERFLRAMNAKSVPVQCAEMQCDLTLKLGSLVPILRTAAQWESQLISAEQRLADKDELHEQMLLEYSNGALQAAVSVFLKQANIAGALSEAMRQATVTAALAVQGKKRFNSAHLFDEESLKKMQRTHPQIYANIRRAQAAADAGVE